MPFYRIYAGYLIDPASSAKIMDNGIPASIYPNTVRVTNFWTNITGTVFEIEADDVTIAYEWRDALIHAIGNIEEYTPQAPEDPDPTPGPLDVWARVGTFTKTIGVSTTVISSLPGDPKGLILWGSALSGATFGTTSDAGATCVGFSDGTAGRCLVYGVEDNTTPANANRIADRTAFRMMNVTGTNSVTGSLESASASFSTNSFTLTWSASTLATVGFYFVFGGDDITSVQVKDFEMGTTATGEVEYTGLGDKYDMCMLLTAGFSSSNWGANFFTPNGIHSVSVHASDTNEKSWCCNIRSSDNVATTANHRLQNRNRLLHTMGGSVPAQQQAAKWQGWTSDGFILNWMDQPSFATLSFTGLFVKGGKWDAGSFIQPTTTQEVPTLLSPSNSAPEAVMAFSINNTALAEGTSSGITGSTWTVGAQDTTGGKGCLSYSGVSAVTNPQENTQMNNNTFMKYITAVVGTTPTTDAQCTISDMATDGQFTVDFTTVDSTERQTVWFSLSA